MVNMWSYKSLKMPNLSTHHNYKQRESIVLMTVCDLPYKFIMVDIGQSGSESDGGIWESSAFRQVLLHGQ